MKDLVLLKCARLWFVFMFIFSLARAYYHFDYFQPSLSSGWTFLGLIITFFSALRFDSFVSVLLVLVCVCLGGAASLIVKWSGIFASRAGVSQRLHFKFSSAFAVSAHINIFLTCLILVSDHFYFVYFQDHFNAIFWEFWENLNNAQFVLAGSGDIVSTFKVIWAVAIFLAVGHLGVLWVFRLKYLPGFYGSLKNKLRSSYLLYSGWVLLICVLGRGTFMGQPLTLQAARLAISDIPFFNLLHTNPLIPLVSGYKDFRRSELDQVAVDQSSLNEDFTLMADRFPGTHVSRVQTNGGSYLTLKHDVMPMWQEYFVRQPKHIVVLFMESFSSWVVDNKDADFRNSIAPSFQKLAAEGLYFANHFPPAGGTLKNLIAANLSFPGHNGATIGMNYRMAGQKEFPFTLPRTMDMLGYSPSFFYAGQLAWHRLYNFIPNLGYTQMYAENSYPDLPHHKFGLYDQGIFQALHEHLQGAKSPTFNFVLSLSNHPPYYLPMEFHPRKISVPEHILKLVSSDLENFRIKLNSFQYSDYALGEFLDKTRTSKSLDETLFIITGDHSNSMGKAFSAEEGLTEELIPLVFWAPKLMKQRWVGRRVERFSSHLDLMPTLASIGARKKFVVDSWGQNILQFPAQLLGISAVGGEVLPQTKAVSDWQGFAYYISCDDGYCLKKNRMYKVGISNAPMRSLRRLEGGDKDQVAGELLERMGKIRKLRDGYHNSALHYFRAWQPSLD